MRKLVLSEWANVAEIIASIVIVFSLAYVGLELNQNTTAMQQSSYQSTLGMLTEGDLLLASDGELNEIVTAAESDPSTLGDDDWSRFSRYAIARIGSWEYMFLARNSNSISPAHWEAIEPYFQNLICTPGYRKFYEENTVFYDMSFVEYVTSVINDECT